MKATLIKAFLSADNPYDLMEKMVTVQYINQKQYDFSPPIFDNGISEYVTWYNVDVARDRPLEDESFEIAEPEIRLAENRVEGKEA